jgi:hypothetical protein
MERRSRPEKEGLNGHGLTAAYNPIALEGRHQKTSIPFPHQRPAFRVNDRRPAQIILIEEWR